MSRKIFDYESFPGAAGTDITAIAATSSDSAGPHWTVTGGSLKADGNGNLTVTGNSNAKGLMPSPSSGQFDAEIDVSGLGDNPSHFGFYAEQDTATYYACFQADAGSNSLVLKKLGGNGSADMPDATHPVTGSPTTPYTFVLQKRIAGSSATLTPILNGVTYPASTDASPNLGSVPSAASILFLGTLATVTRFVVTDPAGTTGTPLTPGTVATSNVTATAATLTLSGDSGGTAPYSIQWQQAPDASGSPGTFVNIGTAGTAVTYAATGLTPGTKYWYRATIADSSSPAHSASTPAVTLTTGPLVLPSLPTLTITTANGIDTIAYTAAIAGTYPIVSYSLYNGTTSGSEGPMALAINPGATAGNFTNNAGGYFYTVRATDSTGNASAGENEAQGGPSTGAVTLSQIQGLLNNLATLQQAQFTTLLTAVLTPARLGVLDAWAAGIAASTGGAALAPSSISNFLNAEQLTTVAPAILAAMKQAAADGFTLAPTAGLTPSAGSLAQTLQVIAEVPAPYTPAENAAFWTARDAEDTTAAQNSLIASFTNNTAFIGAIAEAAAGNVAVDPTLATDLAAVKAKTDLLSFNQAGNLINLILAAAGLDNVMVEPGINLRQALSPILAASAGIVTGGGATGNGQANVAAPQVGPTPGANRITATMQNGTRTNVVLTLPT